MDGKENDSLDRKSMLKLWIFTDRILIESAE